MSQCKKCKLESDRNRYPKKRIPLPPPPDENSKVCSRCRRPKPLTEFYRTFQKRYNEVRHTGACKECILRDARNAYVPRPRKLLTEQEKKAYWLNWQKQNRDKTRAYKETWIEKNREYHDEQTAEYYQLNKDRIREKKREKRKADRKAENLRSKAYKMARRSLGWNPKEPEIVAAVTECLESYRIGNQYWDVYESRLIDEPTIDHIVPVTAGGSHMAENFCVTSLENNASKSDWPLLVWLARRAKRAAKANARSRVDRSRKAAAAQIKN